MAQERFVSAKNLANQDSEIWYVEFIDTGWLGI